MQVVFATVVILMFFGFFYLFIANFMFEVGDSYIMPTIENVSLQYAQQANLSNTTITLITEARANYTTSGQAVPYDLYFFIGIFIVFMLNVSTSLGTRKYGYISFFGLTGIGIMFILALLTVLEQVRTWLMNNIFYAMFGTPTLSTPFIDWFNLHIGWVAFFWIIIMLIINQFDTDILNRNQGRFEE